MSGFKFYNIFFYFLL